MLDVIDLNIEFHDHITPETVVYMTNMRKMLVWFLNVKIFVTRITYGVLYIRNWNDIGGY